MLTRYDTDIKSMLSAYRKYSRHMRDCNKPEYAMSWGMYHHIRNVILHYYNKLEYNNIFNPFWYVLPLEAKKYHLK